jgi:LmbE family N-acetylglucosaminyl deacetylase
LFPHPDDESYAAGGLLALAAAGGAEVTVISATRGERGEDRHGAVAPGDALAALRSEELAAACAALGAQPPVFCDLPDGGLATTDRTAAVDKVRAQLIRLRPHVAVSLGIDGAYGHRDHLAWTAIVGAAIDGLPANHSPRWLQAVFPRRLFAPVWRLAERAGALGAIEQEALGIDRDAAHLVLDVRPARAQKLAALAAHHSQLDVRAGSFFDRLIRPLLDEEWYVVAHGPPLPAGATDPFAGL